MNILTAKLDTYISYRICSGIIMEMENERNAIKGGSEVSELNEVSLEEGELSFADDSLSCLGDVGEDEVFDGTNVLVEALQCKSRESAGRSSVISDTELDRSNNQNSEDKTASITDEVNSEVSRKRKRAELLIAYNTGERRFEKATGSSCINNDIIKLKPVITQTEIKRL